jgi:hypothetical protein
MKAAKQRNVLKESLLDKKHKIEIPSQMRTDLTIFYKTFEPENMLFLNVLQNWRYKIFDDELLMYNIISSFLRFKNKNDKNLLPILNNIEKSEMFNKQILDQTSLLPEHFLLPEHIRELRILEKFTLNRKMDSSQKELLISKLNNKNNNNENNMIKSLRSNQLMTRKRHSKNNNTNQIIQFLWPTHRLEDLAYMNRYWFGTSNQSKFSLLRIRTYPIDES